MSTKSLRTRIFISSILIVFALSLPIGFLGYHIIRKNVFGNAQKQVLKGLSTASEFYSLELESIKKALELTSPEEDLESLGAKAGFDYIYYAEAGKDFPGVISPAASAALTGETEICGTRLISPEELSQLADFISKEGMVTVRETANAGSAGTRVLSGMMVKECALPVRDAKNILKGVIWAGKIINNDFNFVDKIQNSVFGRNLYRGKPGGVVTIFQDDVRIATNVLDEKGKRAVGTKVSSAVYTHVIKRGKPWVGNAFVVTDWYITAYEPISDFTGKRIGMLFVGIYEKPFKDLAWSIFLIFISIILFAIMLAAFASYMIANSVSRPVSVMTDATAIISGGIYDYRLNTDTSIQELDELSFAINFMAQNLKEREEKLKESNDKLDSLNKSYLDLISLVSHELNSILSPAIMNAYSVRDGFLGMINFKQRKALDSITRSLDNLESTVKNFLSLSRIEKGEMAPRNIRPVSIEELLKNSYETYAKQAQEKELAASVEAALNLTAEADPDMLAVVLNNLIGNAVKYSPRGGTIRAAASGNNGILRVEIFSAGKPLEREDLPKLFKRFSRINPSVSAKGSGLGLFISREIIEKHKGRIWAEPGKNGNSFIFEIPLSAAGKHTEDIKK